MGFGCLVRRSRRRALQAGMTGAFVFLIATNPPTPAEVRLTPTWLTDGKYGSASFSWVGDFNGDGKADIASASVRVSLRGSGRSTDD